MVLYMLTSAFQPLFCVELVSPAQPLQHEHQQTRHDTVFVGNHTRVTVYMENWVTTLLCLFYSWLTQTGISGRGGKVVSEIDLVGIGSDCIFTRSRTN